MYLYLGQDTIVRTQDIIGIFDLDNTTVSKITRETLRKMEQNNQTVAVGFDLPKSYVLCADNQKETHVYLSPVTPATLSKRSKRKNPSSENDS